MGVVAAGNAYRFGDAALVVAVPGGGDRAHRRDRAFGGLCYEFLSTDAWLVRQIPVSVLARHLRWSIVGFLVVLPSGLLMFSAHASDLYFNRVFRLKLIVIALALTNVVLFHLSSFRNVASWDVWIPVPGNARAAAAISLVLWLVVIVCGRVIAHS
jgi:hypothetical protein